MILWLALLMVGLSLQSNAHAWHESNEGRSGSDCSILIERSAVPALVLVFRSTVFCFRVLVMSLVT